MSIAAEAACSIHGEVFFRFQRRLQQKPVLRDTKHKSFWRLVYVRYHIRHISCLYFWHTLCSQF